MQIVRMNKIIGLVENVLSDDCARYDGNMLIIDSRNTTNKK